MAKPTKTALLILFLSAVYFPIFLQLDGPGLYRWDECRNAINAFEMEENGNYLIRHFRGKRDTWETKPPLLVWCQVGIAKIVGLNELSVRLPSALAALATVLLMLRFFKKEFDMPEVGAFASFALITCPGYIRPHVTRTGDHDAMLCFFLLSTLLYFYKYLKYPDQWRRYGLALALSIIAAVYSKSIAGLFFLPGLFLYALISGNLLSVLKRKSFYLIILAFVGIVGAYYLSAEYFHPGHLATVWDNELLPRYLNSSTTQKYNQGSVFYYLNRIVWKNFSYFIILVPFCLLFYFQKKKTEIRPFLTLLFCCALSFLLVISKGTTNNWYDAPIYPLLAICAGFSLYYIYNLSYKFLNEKWRINPALYILSFSFILFSYPYHQIIVNKVYNQEHQKSLVMYGEFMRMLKEKHPEIKSYFVHYEMLNGHFIFYHKVFNKYHGYNIKACGSRKIENCKKGQAQVGDNVLVCNKSMKAQIKDKFITQYIAHRKECILVNLSGLK